MVSSDIKLTNETSHLLLSSETVHELLDNLLGAFNFLAIAEIYRIGEFGWGRVASSKNYSFVPKDQPLFDQLLEKHSLRKNSLEQGSIIEKCQTDNSYFYSANLIPTFNESKVAFVLAGELSVSTEQLDDFISNLLPVLSNLHKVHNINKKFQILNQKYQETKASLSRSISLLEGAGDAFFYHDIKGRILDFNPQAVISLGYDKKELYSKRLKDIDIGHDSDISLLHIIKERVKPGEPVTIQSIHLRKDGSKFPVEVTISLDEIGNYLSVARDISKRMLIQKELEHMQAFQKSIIDLSENILYVQDIQLDKIISGSERINKYLGLPPGTISRLADFLPMIKDEDKKMILDTYNRVMESKLNEVVSYEHQYQLLTGEWIWIKTSITVGDRDSDGKASKLYLSSSDITHFKHLEQSLVQSQQKYKSLIENAFDAILVVDSNQQISFASDPVYRIFNYEVGDAQDLKIQSFIHKDDHSKLANAWGYIIKKPAAPHVIESIRINVKDGDYKWTKVTLNNLLSDPHVNGIVINISDISAEVVAKLEAEKQERYYKSLVESSYDGIVLFNKSAKLVFISDSTKKLLGYSISDTLTPSILDHVFEDDLEEIYKIVYDFLLRPFTSIDLPEYRLKKKNGEVIWVQNTLTNLIDDPSIEGIVSNFRDITSRKLSEQTLYKLSNFDSITGLPNRKYLIAQLKQYILKAHDSKSQFGLIIFDIDSLNAINTAHGHVVGDEVIKRVSTVVKESVSPSEFIAKIGDDEFAVLMENQSTYAVSRVTQKIIDSFKPLVHVNEAKVKVTLNAGISIYPKDAINDRNLLSYAEIALKNAKHNLEPFAFYKNYDSEYTKYRLGLEKDLIEAIANDGLNVVFQPVVQATDGSIYCLEALVRWKHPQKGSIEPSLFVKIAEKSNLIAQLSQWVITSVIKQISFWNQQGLFPFVAINLSPLDIRRKNLSHFIAETLEKYGVDPRSLSFEITESKELLEPQFAIAQMQELKQLGIEFTLDDFGTGFSSISHLLNLPISGAKIDQSFVAKAIEDHGEGAKDFLYGVINLIKGSGIRAVVEGIETIEQYEMLSSIQGLYLQGFLLSKPLEINAITSLLEKGSICLDSLKLNN